MLEWSHMTINNTSVCWNEVTWQSIILQYAGMKLHDSDFIPAYWSIIDCHVTSFQHTEVLLILRCSCSCIVFSIAGYSRLCRPVIILFRPAFIFNSQYHCRFNIRLKTRQLKHSDDCNIRATWNATHDFNWDQYASWDFIPAYWNIIDSHVTSFQHTEILLILMWPYSSILKYCWFSGALVLA
jgi:hypothetical protein